MSGKVKSLSAKSNNAMHIGVVESLEQAIEAIKGGEIDPDKCLLLFLNTKDGNYDVRYFNARMSCSECIALLRVSETKFLRSMNYIQ